MEKMYTAAKCKSFDCFSNHVSSMPELKYDVVIEVKNDEVIIVSTDDETVAQYLDMVYDMCCNKAMDIDGNVITEEELARRREKKRADKAYAKVENLEYIVLEKGIPFDWDDYGVYADSLFDMKSGEVIVDKYGHGTGGVATEKNSLLYSYAIALGLVEEKDLREALYMRFFGDRNVSNITPTMVEDTAESLFIPCKVVGGAKFKGECYLLSYTQEKSRYGYDNYSQIVKVYDPKSNEIKKVNSFDYLAFSDDVVSKCCESVMEQRHEHCMTMNLFSLIHQVAYSISYSNCDSRTHREFLLDKSYVNLSGIFEKVDMTGAVDVEESKKEAKKAEFKQSKIADLIEWARSKGLHNESEESLKTFAESIFARKYAYMM